jgi:galactokinase
VSAEKTGRARLLYNRASVAVQRLLDAWNAAAGRRDATLGAARRSSPRALTTLRDVASRVTDRDYTPAFLHGRLEQFAAESIELVPAGTDALTRGALAEFGIVVDRSQRLAEDWLGNQVPETITLQRVARELGAVAASAFGAGFGGSVWALVPSRGASAFVNEWKVRYAARHPGPASRSAFFVSPAGPHAFQF